MTDYLKMMTKWFYVYDESKKSGKKPSVVMIIVALSVVSTLVVKFTPIDIGLTDEQIAQIAEYSFAIFGIVVGWLRYDTTKALAVRVDRLPSDTADDVADEHAANILDDH